MSWRQVDVVEATTTAPLDTDADTIVVGVFENENVAHDVSGGALQALLDAGEARRAFKHLAVAHAEKRRFILVGLGQRAAFDPEAARVAAAVVDGRAGELGARAMCWEVPHHVDDDVVGGFVEGTLLHAYRFDRYKREEDRPKLDRLLVSAHHDVSRAVSEAAVLAQAQNRARDLANAPPNELTPAALASHAEALSARSDSLSVSVLDEDAIREAGMGAFAAVARGSIEDACLIRLEYAPADAGPDRLAMVGKAVTFDSGGLSLKPPASMPDMKFDMSGGAAVIEAIGALAELGEATPVLGVVGATENLPSGGAVKPGDIVRALNGTSIEVNNTDAEGRLVLADCISYAIEQGCSRLVDIATLTGAIVVALGSEYAGLMSSDDTLAAEVQASGRRTGELVWRLPLHERYAKMVKGRYAQLTNNPERREAMAITAAEFLHRFAGHVPWAHLDIAGTAWDVRRPYFDKGGTGFGVRLLVDVARTLR